MTQLHQTALQAIERAYGTIRGHAYVLKGVDADRDTISEALTNANFHTACNIFLTLTAGAAPSGRVHYHKVHYQRGFINGNEKN